MSLTILLALTEEEAWKVYELCNLEVPETAGCESLLDKLLNAVERAKKAA